MEKGNVRQEKTFFLVEGNPVVQNGAAFVTLVQQAANLSGFWDIMEDLKNSEISTNIIVDDLKHSSFVIAFEEEQNETKGMYFKVVTDSTKYGIDISKPNPMNN